MIYYASVYVCMHLSNSLLAVVVTDAMPLREAPDDARSPPMTQETVRDRLLPDNEYCPAKPIGTKYFIS